MPVLNSTGRSAGPQLSGSGAGPIALIVSTGYPFPEYEKDERHSGPVWAIRAVHIQVFGCPVNSQAVNSAVHKGAVYRLFFDPVFRGASGGDQYKQN